MVWNPKLATLTAYTFWSSLQEESQESCYQSWQHMIPDRGYNLAKELLQEHFGNEYKIAAAYIEKALVWPAVKSEDLKALQAYSLFLCGCCNVMEELQYMQELDMN